MGCSSGGMEEQLPNVGVPSPHRTDGSSSLPSTHLVAHLQQRAQGQAEREALVVAHEVAHVLQQEVAGAVELAVRQVRHDLHEGGGGGGRFEGLGRQKGTSRTAESPHPASLSLPVHTPSSPPPSPPSSPSAHHAVLHQRPVALVEPVHARVALAGRSAHDELNLQEQEEEDEGGEGGE